jgi:hypothetical protein
MERPIGADRALPPSRWRLRLRRAPRGGRVAQRRSARPEIRLWKDAQRGLGRRERRDDGLEGSTSALSMPMHVMTGTMNGELMQNSESL